jgi:two-component system CheB/CheR fusion protein
MLVDILGKLSHLPLQGIKHAQKIVADTVYLVPAGESCQMEKGRWQLVSLETGPGPRHSIDDLFTSIASNYPNRCAGVILSGTGTDGLQGMRAIKTAGGTSVAQDPAISQYDGMPRAIIQATLADFILTPAEMGAALVNVFRKVHDNDAVHITAMSLRSFTNLLTRKTGFDFTQYKEPTLRRRIERRMKISKTASLDDYAAYLLASDTEADQFLKDILISVTGFFVIRRHLRRSTHCCLISSSKN